MEDEFKKVWSYEEAKQEQEKRKWKFYEKHKDNLALVVKEVEMFKEDFGVDLQEDKSIKYKMSFNYTLLPIK